MIHIYHGDGKGKTTAAIGLAVRAAGAGKRVLFAQLMKGNESSELVVLKAVPGISVLKVSKNFGFSWNMTEEDKKEITICHNEILGQLLQAAGNHQADVIVLDEIMSCCQLGFLEPGLLSELVEMVKQTTGGKGEQELILTGRNPSEALLEAADYITEMKLIRHPYEKGVAARKGIEW